MDKEETSGKIIGRLERRFPIQPHNRIRDTFSLLIATVLSQNTNDKNSSQAFQTLKKHFKIDPEVLAKLKPEEIKPWIRYAGLYKVRSRRIVELSKTVLKRFSGNLDKILQLPLPEARRILMSLNGVGPKTADILLAFSGNRPIMPVDTNIFRVANRIGLVDGRDYEETRSALEHCIPPEKLRSMHLILIRLGREICKPKKPLCNDCPIYGLCDYPKAREKSKRGE